MSDGTMLVLELAKVEILAPDFSVGTKGDVPQDHFPIHH